MDTLNENLLSLYQFISENYKTNANDIFYSIEFLIESIRDSKNSILKSVQNEDDFDKISELTEYGKLIMKIERALNSYLDSFAAMSPESDEDVEDESPENEKAIPNYRDYEVDSEIPHLLTESFTHKKICGFFLNNVRYNVSDWKSSLLKICELLYEKDSVLFNSVIVSDRFKGSKIEYFSHVNKGKYYRRLKNTDIYVWTCHSANAICSLIRRLLLEYGIPSNSLYIYLRADYTSLHTDEKKTEHIPIQDTNDDMKIGKFVKTSMRNLSASGYVFDNQMLNLLLTDEYTKQTFGIGTSFFKEIRNEKQIRKLTKDAKGYNRYWCEVFEFNGRKFIVVSQWTTHNADRFKSWLAKLSQI